MDIKRRLCDILNRIFMLIKDSVILTKGYAIFIIKRLFTQVRLIS